jgi:hypothetical protein
MAMEPKTKIDHVGESSNNLPDRQFFADLIVYIMFSYVGRRHYATIRKVAGSSPDEVDFFYAPGGRLSL